MRSASVSLLRYAMYPSAPEGQVNPSFAELVVTLSTVRFDTETGAVFPVVLLAIPILLPFFAATVK